MEPSRDDPGGYGGARGARQPAPTSCQPQDLPSLLQETNKNKPIRKIRISGSGDVLVRIVSLAASEGRMWEGGEASA